MFKVGKLTDYGTLLMTAMAVDADTLKSAQELSARTHVAAPTVAKLLKQLCKSGLVESVRGAHGGYRLARPAAIISVADVMTAIEGPIALTQCESRNGHCGIQGHCGVRANWRLIGVAIRQALEAVTLEQMAAPMRPGAFPLQSQHAAPKRTEHGNAGTGHS